MVRAVDSVYRRVVIVRANASMRSVGMNLYMVIVRADSRMRYVRVNLRVMVVRGHARYLCRIVVR
jgi:hypothetical protein